jgi:formate-dependent nitrite reductase membrane component NrfD
MVLDGRITHRRKTVSVSASVLGAVQRRATGREAPSLGRRDTITRVNTVLERMRTMPSSSDALLRSIRRWLLVGVSVLGVAVVALAHLGYVVSNYESGGVALVAAAKALGSPSTTE